MGLLVFHGKLLNPASPDTLQDFISYCRSTSGQYILHPSMEGDHIGAVIHFIDKSGERECFNELLSRLRKYDRISLSQVKRCDLRVPIFDRPIIIVAAPRSGSTLLFEILAKGDEIWSIGFESHHVIERNPSLKVENRGYDSHRLTERDATPEISADLLAGFASGLRDRDGGFYSELPPKRQAKKIRFLEKTPKSCIRIPFLAHLFPGARFVFLYRSAPQSINSIAEGWKSRRFQSFKNLPGWPTGSWSFYLPPSWQSAIGKSLFEIAAFQWITANSYILADLAKLPKEQWTAVDYSDLIANPDSVIRRICAFGDISVDDRLQESLAGALPLSRTVNTLPDENKWQAHRAEIEAVLPSTLELGAQLRSLEAILP